MAQVEEPAAQPRSHQLLAWPNALALLAAAWFYAQSLAPSLLPRSWVLQGVVSGVSMAVGFWIGLGLCCLTGWLLRRTRWATYPSSDLREGLESLVRVTALGVAVWGTLRAVPQHEWTWERLGHQPDSFGYFYVGSALVALVVAATLLTLGWLLHRGWHRLTRMVSLVLPAWIAGGLALVLVAWGVTASLNRAVLQRSLDAANTTFAAADANLDDAPEQPDSAYRSGGPRSAIGWAEAGNEGRRFLTRGPSTADLSDFAAGPVEEPVRVFVGRAEERTLDERVDVALRELDAFGAFERKALLVVVPTGTGWINEQIVQPLEYFFAGDIATVSIQYSHLPSPLAFLAEQEAAADTGEALIEAVEERLATLEDPPLLYVAGESLGSYGGAHAFTSLADSVRRTTGTLWVGPPEMMTLRREAERRRTRGSTQVRPVIGDDILFVNRASDFDGVGESGRPKAIFLQQADDPIVWWDWETSYDRPDWLEEPLDPAVNPHMSWSAVTTFLQLAVDMAVSNDFDEEHGHLYGTLPLTAWSTIVGPKGWDPAKLERLRERLVTVTR